MPETETEPAATPVSVTEQVPATNAQLAPTVPTRVFVEARLSIPPGILPAVVVSATVTTHVDVPVGTIIAGLQTILSEVLSLEVTVTRTVVVAAEVVAPDGLPVTMKL